MSEKREYQGVSGMIRMQGENAQLDKIIEEMAELTQAIQKWKKTGSSEEAEEVLEEYGDVEVVLRNIPVMFGKEEAEEAVKEAEKKLGEKIMEGINNE